MTLATYRDYLKAKGYDPQAHDDYILFRHERLHFVLELDADDPDFASVLLPNFWSVESAKERRKALEVAASLSSKFKLIKVVFMPTKTHSGGAKAVADVSARVDLLLGAADQFAGMLPRAVEALVEARRAFGLIMQA